MTYQWDFGAVLRHSGLLMEGIAGTLWLTGSALLIAVPLGLILAALRLSRLPVLSQIAVLYIDLFRTAAALVLVFWFFYALPILMNVRLDAYGAAALAIGLQGSAYFAEVYRAGIASVSRGQWDGARAIGLNYAAAMRYVILPQAIRRMIPVFFTRTIEILKTSSLAAAIAYAELTYNASRVALATYRPIETYTVVAAIYFAIIFTLARIVGVVERRLAVSD
jgi:polar amino acid transport system permease protein